MNIAYEALTAAYFFLVNLFICFNKGKNNQFPLRDNSEMSKQSLMLGADVNLPFLVFLYKLASNEA